MLEGHDGADVGAADVRAGVPLDNHSLLLSLAGLIDDDLLGWSRELAAVGEFDYALDLITATISAEDVRLPGPVHAALVAAQRGGPGVELPRPAAGPPPAHRFLADPASAGYPAAIADSSPVEAVRGLPGRLLRGCRLWLSWRLTPAGGSSTPVPHPVLLVETADGAGADLLAYQVSDLIGRSGAFVSVEVFGPDSVVGEYHRAALDASTELKDLEFTGSSVQLEAVRVEPGRFEPGRFESGRVDTGRVDTGRVDTTRFESARFESAADTAPPLAAASALPDPPLPQRESARPPLQPVERVQAARASTPRNPIDNVMPFERGPQERPPADRPVPARPLFDRGAPDPLDRLLVDRPFAAFDDGFGSGAVRPVPPREPRGRRDDTPPPGPARPPNGPRDWPASSPDPVGPPPGPSGLESPSGPQGPVGPRGPLGPPPSGPITGAFPAQGPGSGPPPHAPGPGGPGPQGPGGSQAMAGPPPGSMSGAFPASQVGPSGPNVTQPGFNPGQPAGPNPGPGGPNPGQPGPGGPNPGPPGRPMDRRPPANGMPPRNGAGPDRPGPGPERNGPDRNGVERTAMMPERAPGPDRHGPDRNAATRAVPPVRPVSQPTARQPAPPPFPPKGQGPHGQGPGPQAQGPLGQGPGPQGQGPLGQGPGPQGQGPLGQGPAGPPGQPQRPPLRPVDLPELPDGLSDVEQKLLRQLHEELAAREDGPSTAGKTPQGAYRNGSNGSARPPQKSAGSDQAG